MNCPVCDDPNNPEGAESCANCGSDLRAFHEIQRVQKQRGNYKTASFSLAALSLLLLIFVIGSSMMASTNDQEAEAPASTEAISEEAAPGQDTESLLKEKDQRIAFLEDEINELIATMQSYSHFVHDLC